VDGSARQEDFLFAEHVLRRGFATEEQVQECLHLLERMSGELGLEETLENMLLRKGYVAQAQVSVIRNDINPEAGRNKNQIEGYQLLTRLGSGAMGSVYKAHHQKLNIHVALKVLRVDLAKSKTQVARLKREAQLAARLNHINIVRSLDVGESNGFHYFAMEFVNGKTVRQMLHPGRLKEKDALRITRDVARALDHAHKEGVVHRDVKPANIILTREGVVKLADFGLARGQEPSDLTLDQASIGTPQYLAPEQARRAVDATGRSDLFSLGASLYHMVTGRPPFSGGNLGEIFQKVLATEFDPPESVVPDLSVDTVYLIHKLMRGNPRERYHTAGDLVADLERLERGERIAPADFKGDYAVYIRKRRARRAVAAVAAMAILLAAVTFTAARISRSRAENRRVALCTAADDFGEFELKKAGTVARLQSLGRSLRAARPGQCRPSEVERLDARIAAVKTALVHLTQAESTLVAARGKEPDFRGLYRNTESLVRMLDLPGPRQRAEDIRDEIEKLSARAANAHYARVYRPIHKTRDDALAALEGLERSLHDRYLPGRLSEGVSGQTAALRSLIADWKEADETYRKPIENHRDKHRYTDAHRELDRFMEAREKALRHARGGGLHARTFLDFFPEKNPYDLDLKRHERSYFDTVVKGGVKKHLDKNDPDAAEDLLLKFEPHAFVTRARVDREKDDVKIFRVKLVERQGEEITTLEGVFHRTLAARRWGRAWNLVRKADKRTDWMPANRRKLELIVDRARKYTQLLDRYLEQAAKRKIQPSGGEDRDLLLDAQGEPWARSGLLDLLAFDKTKGLDIILRGYFFVGESFVARDPRTEREMLNRALSDLVGRDSYTETLRRREQEAIRRVKVGEDEADKTDAVFLEARAKKDHATALKLVVVLLKRLGWTEYVKGRRPELERMKKKLERLGRTKLLEQEAGIPARNFGEDLESGRVRLVMNFKEWWPDENEFANPQANRKLLDDAARKYWRRIFEDLKVKLTPRLFERAKHQLLLFDEHLVIDKKHGGARFSPGRDRKGAPAKSNTGYWERGPRDALRAIVLRNPLRTDKDWSIELTVSWDVTTGGETKPRFKPATHRSGRPYWERSAWHLPLYFSLSAGEFQAGVLAMDGPYGQGFGARLFRQRSLSEGIEQKFSEFYARRLEGKRKPNKPDAKYVLLEEPEPPASSDNPAEGRYDPTATIPYRMRLERRGGWLRFLIARDDSWKKRGGRFDERRDTVLVTKVTKHTIAKHIAMDGKAVFRIFSLEPCRIHEVVLEGFPAQ